MNPYELCPRFEKCSVNVCPLHFNFRRLQDSPNDPEQKCTLPKTIRKRLGISLSWKGLTDSELAAQKRWDSLPEEVKQSRIAKIQERSLFIRLSKKGYAITRKSSSQVPEAHKNEITSLNSALKNEPSTGSIQKEAGSQEQPLFSNKIGDYYEEV